MNGSYYSTQETLKTSFLHEFSIYTSKVILSLTQPIHLKENQIVPIIKLNREALGFGF